VKSKLGILSSYADAADGLVTHGWITKIETHGCFVRFYNGVQGFAPRLVSGHVDNSFSNFLYMTSLDQCHSDINDVLRQYQNFLFDGTSF